MRRLFLSVAALIFVAAPAMAQVATCNQAPDPERQRAACTALIASGGLSPTNLVRAYGKRGEAHRALGNPEAAIADFSSVIGLEPEYAAAWLNRGLAFAEAGRHRRAIEDFDRALVIEPNLAPAFLGRGNAYLALGKTGGAIFEYGRALERDPRLVEAYVNRGIAWASAKPRPDRDRAMANFDRALRLDAGHAEGHYNRADLLRDLGRHREAIRGYDTALRLRPDHPWAFNNRGLAYAALGQHRRALSDFRKALNLAGGDPDIHENRASSLQANSLSSPASSHSG